MRKNSLQDYAKALYEITKDRKGADLKKALEAFVVLLSKKNVIKKAPIILKAYERYARKKEGHVAIEVTTAREIDKATLGHITKVFGDKVDTTEKIDTSLIGGVVIRTEDTILDASLKTQLQNLKTHLV
jgi:F-type H+-transporting ATPase subunit delta